MLPTLGALTRNRDDIAAVAEEILTPLANAIGEYAQVSVTSCMSQIGSGALPGDSLPSLAISIRPLIPGNKALEHLVTAFRSLPIPVIGHVHRGDFLMDLRTLTASDIFVRQLDQLKL